MPIDREKLLTIGHLSRGLTRDHVEEARAEDGTRKKAVTDENNATVTEYSKRGSGVSCRQDVNIRPETLRVNLEMGQ